jgi:C-terminal processing protease CtpA/Prc
MMKQDISRLNRFSFTTVKEFEQALAMLKSQKMKNLILDLRDNGGGYLQESIYTFRSFSRQRQNDSLYRRSEYFENGLYINNGGDLRTDAW